MTKRGGTKPLAVYNETEGTVEVYPTHVIKIYNKGNKYFTAELEGFQIFDRFDPDFQFHPRLLDVNNPLSMVMENVGETVTNDLAKNMEPYIRFLIQVFGLHDENGNYILHPDGHANNVCINEAGQVKYIDLGGLQVIPASQQVDDNIMQNLEHNLSAVAYLDPRVKSIIDESFGKPYSQVMNELISQLNYILTNFYLYQDEIAEKFAKAKRKSQGERPVEDQGRPSKGSKKSRLKEDNEDEDDYDPFASLGS